MKEFYVYIMANHKHGQNYIGVTSNLIQRVYQHKNDFIDGFTRKYRCHSLVYYEGPGDFETMVTREKRMKDWKKLWKWELIEKHNPEWQDLYDVLF